MWNHEIPSHLSESKMNLRVIIVFFFFLQFGTIRLFQNLHSSCLSKKYEPFIDVYFLGSLRYAGFWTASQY